MAGLKLTCLSCAQVNRVPADRLAAAKCATCGAKLADGKVTEVDLATLQKAARNDDLPAAHFGGAMHGNEIAIENAGIFHTHAMHTQ